MRDKQIEQSYEKLGSPFLDADDEDEQNRYPEDLALLNPNAP